MLPSAPSPTWSNEIHTLRPPLLRSAALHHLGDLLHAAVAGMASDHQISKYH
ncbi:Hypothetical protein MIP_03134 [Mycobacterium intracellulare subsp. intracellulare MTCC 9506]|uniref:Uncharacterized protein n=1 Tax=Mycobacterium indicus pranii (strain DSM 45239 / MTCC 9506) TaxID=1232724 RepID=J9WFQ9_MYCIP|nr:Hypothetical protein MIP_03134 [Mycobacterium intracellulare subsp. intracellulare MTCC 9506]